MIITASWPGCCWAEIDALAPRSTPSRRARGLIAALPDDAGAIDYPDRDGPGAGPGAGGDADPDPATTGGANAIRIDPATGADCVVGTVERLDEIPGIGAHNAQAILAEIGLDMSRFPTPEHLVSWAKLCPRTIQSGPMTRAGKTGRGNPYLKGALGEAAAAAAKTDTFLGERYRRIVKRRGKLKALVAVARSILVIVWHLLANPASPLPRPRRRLPHQPHRTPNARLRNHIAQLTAMGYRVTLEPAA